FSWLFWGIVPNGLSSIGILLIILAGVIIVLAPQKPNEELLNTAV
ncbi:MAG: drug/metabolite transporter (DMT)-like permease, partial [Oceanospirillaceae bacterium]